jgi:hypothetical protein
MEQAKISPRLMLVVVLTHSAFLVNNCVNFSHKFLSNYFDQRV